MRTRTLLTQVLAVNSLLVGLTAVVAAVVARDRLSDATGSEGLLPGCAVGPELFGDRRCGQLSQAAIGCFACYITAWHAFAPTDRAIREFATYTHVIAFVPRGRGVFERTFKRKPDDIRGERSNAHG